MPGFADNPKAEIYIWKCKTCYDKMMTCKCGRVDYHAKWNEKEGFVCQKCQQKKS